MKPGKKAPAKKPLPMPPGKKQKYPSTPCVSTAVSDFLCASYVLTNGSVR